MEEKVKEAVEQALQQRDYEQEIQALTEQVEKLEKQSNKDTLITFGLIVISVALAFVTLITLLSHLEDE